MNWVFDENSKCIRCGVYCVDYSAANNKWFAFYSRMPAEFSIGDGGTLIECLELCEADSVRVSKAVKAMENFKPLEN